LTITKKSNCAPRNKRKEAKPKKQIAPKLLHRNRTLYTEPERTSNEKFSNHELPEFFNASSLKFL